MLSPPQWGGFFFRKTPGYRQRRVQPGNNSSKRIEVRGRDFFGVQNVICLHANLQRTVPGEQSGQQSNRIGAQWSQPTQPPTPYCELDNRETTATIKLIRPLGKVPSEVAVASLGRLLHVYAPAFDVNKRPRSMITASDGKATKFASFGVSLPLIAVIVTFVSAIGSGTVLNDADTYWHLAAGRWILEHSAVPTSDPFSFTMFGAPWTAHEWGSELVMTLLYSLAGWRGLHLFFSMVFAGTAAFVTRQMLHHLEPVHVIILMALCIAMMHTHFLIRPHVLAWPFLAVWFATLSRCVESEATPPLWLLPLLVAWTNLHASFTLGLAFLAAFALDAFFRASTPEARKRVILGWGTFGFSAGVFAMINPRGWHAFIHAIDLMGMKVTLSVVQEWESTNFHEPQLLLIWLLLVLLLAIAGKLRLPLWRGVMVFFMLFLALKHDRYNSLLALTSPFLIVPALRTRLGSAGSEANESANGSISRLDSLFESLRHKARPATMAVTCVATAATTWLLADRWRVEPAASATPEAALSYAQRSGLSGPVFNAYGFGGYLIFRGVPVFVDGRADMYGDPYIAKLASALSLSKNGELEQLLDEHQISWTLLQPNLPAVRLLDLLPEWERVYSDSVAVIHKRRARRIVRHDTAARYEAVHQRPVQSPPHAIASQHDAPSGRAGVRGRHA